MRRIFGVLLAGMVLVGAGCSPSSSSSSSSPSSPSSSSLPSTPSPVTSLPPTSSWTFQGKFSSERIDGKIALIQTEKGEIVVELFASTAPITVSNFVYLTEGGYYDGLTFHRRVEEFVIQGGDPNGNGTGGPGYRFQDELNDSYGYKRGIVAMANAGPDTNGSQFFIMLDDVELPKKYSIFGRVLSGLDVVDQIQIGDKMTKVLIEDKPLSE